MKTFRNNQGLDIFNSVKKKRQQRSSFDLSHDVKLSLDMGLVVPIYLQEIVPGDNVDIRCTSMIKFAPLVSPVMHRMNVFMEYFFVPNRILWSNWETFITGSRNGKQLEPAEMPAFPMVQPYDESISDTALGGLPDYLGIPPKETFKLGEEPPGLLRVNALPFAAYQRVWDEYYRDENLVESMYDVAQGFNDYNMLPDGVVPDEVNQQLTALRPRLWEKDYFTSALPWAQKGEPVAIPIDVTGSGIAFNPEGETKVVRPDGFALPNDHKEVRVNDDDGDNTGHLEYQFVTDSYKRLNIDNSSNLDLSVAASGVKINDLRAAFKLQEWLETNAIGGTRYFESIYAHFGVHSPDSRLQRPEFIGSYRSAVTVGEVAQTSSPNSETDTPQGNLSGQAESFVDSNQFSYYAQEHGFIIGIMSVMPKPAYTQGIERFWHKTGDRLDYYFPEFAHLGEQEIMNIELYAGGNGEVNEVQYGTFGYTPRYAEYKFMPSRIAGDFRDTLKFWHLGRFFDDSPVLNDSFLSIIDGYKRIFAVQDLPSDNVEEGGKVRSFNCIYAHVFHSVSASRLMPKYGTPTL